MWILVPFSYFFLLFCYFWIVDFMFCGFLFGILDMFDVFVLVFLSFRFKKNARTKQKRDLSENVKKI